VHKGWFEETLPTFTNKYMEKAAFLHIDSDLYSSAKTILHWLDERIVENTVILLMNILISRSGSIMSSKLFRNLSRRIM